MEAHRSTSHRHAGMILFELVSGCALLVLTNTNISGFSLFWAERFYRRGKCDVGQRWESRRPQRDRGCWISSALWHSCSLGTPFAFSYRFPLFFPSSNLPKSWDYDSSFFRKTIFWCRLVWFLKCCTSAKVGTVTISLLSRENQETHRWSKQWCLNWQDSTKP